ncbi:MAG: hypothetical protein V3W18_05975 [candidate division Zixibacteria bacterium]
MEYMEIVKRSFINAWEYKFLWLFGFFVSITDGFGGWHWWSDKFDRGDWGGWSEFDDLKYLFRSNDRLEDFFDFHIEPVVVLLVIMGILALGVVFWALSVLSEGALVRGISRKHYNLETGFGDCWSTGLNKFFRLFGITLLAFISVFAVLFILIIMNIPFWFVFKPLGIMITIFSVPLFFAVIVAIICVEGWAIRYGVLYDKSWLDAISDGISLFKNNIGKTLGVAFSSFLSQLIIWFMLVICMLFIAVPFIILGMYDLWLGLIPGLAVAFLIIVFSSAIFGVFASSVWTLGFIKLTGYSEEQESSEAELAVS